MQRFAPIEASEPLYTGVHHIAVNTSGDLALVGGTESTVGIYSLPENKLVQEIPVDCSVTDVCWAGSAVVAATSKGQIRIFEDGAEHSNFLAHAGSANAIALHPSRSILASVGSDKTYVFYDLSKSTKALQVATDSGMEALDIKTPITDKFGSTHNSPIPP